MRVKLGAGCWLLTVVFFAGQAVSQAASRAPYSLVRSYISDLGAARCGPEAAGTYHVLVCSPLHDVMNAAFVAAGALTALGAVATHPAWPRRRLTLWGLGLVVLSGAGQVLVGFAPEDVHLALHGLGALFGLAGANLGIALLGAALWRTHRTAGALSLLAGVAGLVGFVLIVPAAAAGAAGAVERVSAYLIYVWLIAMGGYLASGRRWAPAPTSASGQEGSVPDTRAPLT